MIWNMLLPQNLQTLHLYSYFCKATLDHQGHQEIQVFKETEEYQGHQANLEVQEPQVPQVLQAIPDRMEL